MPTDSFRSLGLKPIYRSPQRILESFYIPVLRRSVAYDRGAGFFSSGALVVAAQGLAELIRNGGRMRLLVGAQLTPEDVDAIAKGSCLEEVSTERLVALLSEPENELHRKRLEALAWMVAAGTLKIKVVLPLGPDGMPLAGEDAAGYFHVKHGVFVDCYGDRVAFHGSANESLKGWLYHYEEIYVSRSWEEWERGQVEGIQAAFERLWEDREEGWKAIPIPEAAKKRLLTYAPEEPPEFDPFEVREERPVFGVGWGAVESPAAEKAGQPAEKTQEYAQAALAQFIRDVPYLIGSRGAIAYAAPAIEPWPHQVHVASEIVSRFPERFLLADEVGLGKTVEAGLVLRSLLASGAIKRCLILAPASVVGQWQDELFEKFGLDVPIYDGYTLRRAGQGGEEREPLGHNVYEETPLVIVSSQLAKRKDRRGELLSGPDWDLVIVDEAHHARRTGFVDLADRRPNRLLELLEGVDGLPGLASKTRGLLMLTATPMQIHPVEVWDLLCLLGLPGRWGASEYEFLRYFEELRKARLEPQEADWDFLARMARAELDLGGGNDPALEEVLTQRLGVAGKQKVLRWPYATQPANQACLMDDDERECLLYFLRQMTPVRRRMFRHTRVLLKEYEKRGLLQGSIADREAEPRWIELEGSEKELYDRIDEYMSSFYHKLEGERKGLGFVMTVYRRRLTSSFYALRKSLQRRLQFLQTRLGLEAEGVEVSGVAFREGLGPPPHGLIHGQASQSDYSSVLGLAEGDELDDDLAADVVDELATVSDPGVRAILEDELGYVEDFIRDLERLGVDSKLHQLMDDLQRALSARETVVIFSQYADTVDYLKERLAPVYGSRVATFTGAGGQRWRDGVWLPASKEEIKSAFGKGEIQILLGTDALAEGLNLQTCGVEINYDAPWNPMRLEQRIGRIDRIGQRHPTVWVWTYFVSDTVEAIVYERLWERIGSFTDIVGPLQPILGRVEDMIKSLALADPAERAELLDEELPRLDNLIQKAKTEGIDLLPTEVVTASGGPDYLAKRLVDTSRPAVSQDELRRFVVESPRLSSVMLEDSKVQGAFRRGDVSSPELFTFDPEVADRHPGRVRLLSPGDPVLDRLLDAAYKFPPPGALAGSGQLASFSAEGRWEGRPDEMAGKAGGALSRQTVPPAPVEPSEQPSFPGGWPRAVRFESRDGARRLVCWFGVRDGEPVELETFEELRAAMESPAEQSTAWLARAQERFSGQVANELSGALEGDIRRAKEGMTALLHRACDCLLKAASLWWISEQNGDMEGADPTVSVELVRAMADSKKVPFSSLFRLVVDLFDVLWPGDELGERFSVPVSKVLNEMNLDQKVAQSSKSRRGLHAKWGALYSVARDLTEKLLSAKSELEVLESRAALGAGPDPAGLSYTLL